ncbi:transposase [Weizmannia acidilactici]|uniref:Transposase n=1 Tax=Weizmannia acidilactici TaxID=2607726 RepID=A0A5J4JNC2_9BACI|nr:helix-turn-helix domain-containing protein [Weizmannia acidilactici]GER66518.1 transposase [Weizmannia acidilactici]GER71877.1 transposase [Weizmannia acidilactici]GER72336.1 transposase [Weizmannia acidilactici]
MYKQYTTEFKLEVLLAYENRECTIQELCKRYKITKYSLRQWLKEFGKAGLERANTWKGYTKELQEAAVKDYLSGEFSQYEIVRKYGISSRSVLQRWIKEYNSHRELKDTSKGKTSSMTKGRKTTWNERIQIVLDCLRNGKDYKKTAETYEVSYQPVYQWVKKYGNGGEEALKDKRGRKKEEAELSPEKKMKREMKKLERENERLRAENLFLKKLEEIERRRK